MKRLIYTSFFLALTITLSAQLTLDKRYDLSASVVKLETSGYKYYSMDVPNSECKIYNLDHSVFKTISCPTPTANHYLADINYISENVFDNDDGIELVYTYYKYVPTQSSYYYEYDSKIINEDGTVIQTIDGARYIYINQTDENTHKLFVYCYDYSVFPEIVWTNIYNLQGAPLAATLLDNNSPETWIKAYPNPASQKVKVAYSLPENINTGNLYLFDNNGRAVEQFVVDNHTEYLELNISEYKSGIYHYFIEYGNTKTPSKKLLIR